MEGLPSCLLKDVLGIIFQYDPPSLQLFFNDFAMKQKMEHVELCFSMGAPLCTNDQLRNVLKQHPLNVGRVSLFLTVKPSNRIIEQHAHQVDFLKMVRERYTMCFNDVVELVRNIIWFIVKGERVFSVYENMLNYLIETDNITPFVLNFPRIFNDALINMEVPIAFLDWLWKHGYSRDHIEWQRVFNIAISVRNSDRLKWILDHCAILLCISGRDYGVLVQENKNNIVDLLKSYKVSVMHCGKRRFFE